MRVVLKNNVVVRRLRQKGHAEERIGEDTWQQLDELEREIVTLLVAKGKVGRADIENITKKSTKTVNARLKKLMDMDVIYSHGKQYDPNRTYEIKL